MKERGRFMKLSDIQNPQSLRNMTYDQLDALSEEIRRKIISTVSINGGHLASNLGTVELTIALHRAFDFQTDRLVFDVGHQCYTHKLLTGRYDKFSTLRQTDGLCGFPRTDESIYDAYNTGHSSTAISAALGMARARDLKQEKNYIVALVGDGAMTGGMCYEALNDAGSSQTPLIVILNDNGMSISKNVGALSNYLLYMRTSKGWQKLKRTVADTLRKIPRVGNTLYKIFLRFKNSIRNVFIQDKFFSSLDFKYLGPIDGHDIHGMEKIFKRVKTWNEPVLVHVVTKKGRGFRPAEDMPETFHGTPPFDVESGEALVSSAALPSFGKEAGCWACKMAEKNEDIVVVTAAMTSSTGFEAFQKQYPKRLFDVGIAEEHAVTMAAGLAANGMRPIVPIYDSFFQRAYDQLLEEAASQRLPIIFLLDRAGIGGEDGSTHHGVFGTSYLRNVPNLTLLYPRCCDELRQMLDWAYASAAPVIIRYPRTQTKLQPKYLKQSFQAGSWEPLLTNDKAHISLLAVGSMTETALQVAQGLSEHGIAADVMNASSIKPLDNQYLRSLNNSSVQYLFTIEEQVLDGGFGSAVSEACVQDGFLSPSYLFALPDQFIPHGNRSELLRRNHLDAESITKKILEVAKP